MQSLVSHSTRKGSSSLKLRLLGVAYPPLHEPTSLSPLDRGMVRSADVMLPSFSGANVRYQCSRASQSLGIERRGGLLRGEALLRTVLVDSIFLQKRWLGHMMLSRATRHPATRRRLLP